MTFAPRQRFGAYEIVSPLGAGGMGEVYRPPLVMELVEGEDLSQRIRRGATELSF